MCFAPQQRALFRHLNFQKTLNMVYFARLTWKCASRHNSVHFFDISTPKSAPNMVFCAFWLGNVLCATTACTFSTSQLPKVLRAWCVCCTFWLGNVLRATTACNFSSLISLWSSLFFSSLLWLFPPLLFHLSILSEVWLLNFLRYVSLE